MKPLKVLLPCLCCLLILFATDCNKSKSKSQAQMPVIHKVIISGMKFHPANLTVAKGDTVIWINKDIVTHNVTAYPGKEWTSGPITNGESWKKVITGSFKYYCSIHPAMRGKIKLKGSK